MNNQFSNSNQNPNRIPNLNQNPNINQNPSPNPLNQQQFSNVPQNQNQNQFSKQTVSQFPNYQPQAVNTINQSQTIPTPTPNSTPGPIENPKKEKNSNSILFLLILAIIVSAIIVGFIIYKSYKTNQPQTPTTIVEELDKKFIYKIRYDVDCESYIYLLENDEIKVLKIKGSRESDRERKTIKFENSSMRKILRVLDEIHDIERNDTINTSNLKLSDNQKRILTATVTENEDIITLENYIGYDITEEIIKNQNYIPIISNYKTTMIESKENIIVDKMAKYLNKIIDKEFDETNKYSKDIVKENFDDLQEKPEDFLGIEHNLKFEHANKSAISFTFSIKGSLGNVSWNTKKGYNFDYNGNIKNFPTNLQDKYYEKALDEFSNTDSFREEKDQLSNDWKSIIKKEIFKPESWYLKEEKVVFLIEGYRLGFDETTAKTIELEILLEDEI